MTDEEARDRAALEFAKIHENDVTWHCMLCAPSSGRLLTYENLQSEAEKKKGSRIAKLKAWASGDRDI